VPPRSLCVAAALVLVLVLILIPLFYIIP
jgi:hypothetical protein